MVTLATMWVMEQFNEAVTFAQSHEIPWPRDPTADLAHWGVHHDDPPPFNRLRGPVHPRGGVSGVIRVHGEEVAAWGEPDRADQTFSVAKTYLALLAGIAHARGLLEPSERVSDRLPGIGFDSAHNRVITWEHLLTQTSEWQGECFGMPDQVEHYRHVSHDPKPPAGKKGSFVRCASQAAFGNTTTCASTSSRWRCFISSSGRCRRCSSKACCGRSAAAAISVGGVRRCVG